MRQMLSEQEIRDNGAAIPPNLIALAHTESNTAYLRHCAKRRLKPHPARFPEELPEYFIRMLTDNEPCINDVHSAYKTSIACFAAMEAAQRRRVVDIKEMER